MTAAEILAAAAGHMQDRASTYDKPEGERSMGRAVAAFNAVTGRDLTEAEGWLLLQQLKNVRLFTRPGFHRDSAEDAVAYAALAGEAKSAEAIDHALQVAGQAADLLAECRHAAEQFIAGAVGVPADLEPAVVDSIDQNAGKGPCLSCGGPHPLHRCGRGRPTGEDEGQ